MRVLVACEFSGIVRDAFLRRGVETYSCDIIPSEPWSPWHIQGDVTPLLREQWDLVIAHPPCTYLANSGVQHLHVDPERWLDLFDGVQFFKLFQNLDHIPFVAIENPIPHKYATREIGKYTQLIQPWMFGHLESKAVCLWLKNLPKLVPTTNLEAEMKALPKQQAYRVHLMSPGPERQKQRSLFFKGIAEAMADQWLPLVSPNRLMNSGS